MKIVLDIGETQADVPAVLAAMDGDGLELVGVNGWHVGCRITGLLQGGVITGTYEVVPLDRAP